MDRLEWTFLGRVEYSRALEMQRRQVERVAEGGAARILLLEHPPTITLGRAANPRNLLVDQQELEARGVGLYRVLRGGDVTYHGPGQLVGYPIAHLGRVGCSVPDWVHGHAQALITWLDGLGVRACWSSEHPGVWVEGKKIAAVGFHLAHRISSHGFALNMDPDLSHYHDIVPCGLRGAGVTSLAQLGVDVPPAHLIARDLAGLIAHRFGLDPVPLPVRTAVPGDASGVRADDLA